MIADGTSPTDDKGSLDRAAAEDRGDEGFIVPDFHAIAALVFAQKLAGVFFRVFQGVHRVNIQV